MPPKTHKRRWILCFFVAFLPGLHLQRVGGSTVLDSEAQFYRPVLQQRETVPTAGSYTLRDLAGRPCIKAVMGAEYIVIENKTNWYFNLDPSRVKLRGKCNKDEALLSLMLPDNSASLDFTFKKDKDYFYVTKLAARLFPLPVFEGCPKDECWADFNRRAVPIIIGSVAVGLMLSFVLSFLFIRDRQRPGYERL